MARRVTVLFSVFSVIATCCGLAASGGAASAATAAVKAPALPGATETWGNAEPVPGLRIGTPTESGVSYADLGSVSCTAPGDCSAGGFAAYGTSPLLAFVVDERDGTWGKARYVADTSAVLPGGVVASVSCASPGNCAAVGDYGTRSTQAFIVNETRGTWGKAEAVPGLEALNRGTDELTSVSCTAVGDCTAGGEYDSSNGSQAFVVDEKDGIWGAAYPVPHVAGLASTGYGADVTSVSCASPGNCTAGGWAQDVAGAQAFVMDETGGNWGSATEVPGSAALNIGADATVNSVSCTAVGDCTVGGFFAAGPDGHYTVDWQAFVADETGGAWGDAREVPGTAALNAGDDATVISVSCASPGDCAAAGTYSTTPGDLRGQAPFKRAFVVNETDGTWGKAESVPGTVAEPSGADSVSCASPGNCVAGGDYHGDMTAGTDKAFVADETDGTWSAAQNVPGLTAINTRGSSYVTAVSCASVTDCAAGGSYYYGVNAGNSDAFVADKSVHQPTATLVRLSAPKVAYGNERAEHISVKVAAGSGGTPAGTVTVKSGATTVCTVTLASGKGSCSPSAGRFPAGLVKITASYGGSFVFGTSVSKPAGFVVVKAATKTSLTLSAAKVTYGHEQSEKLSVTVTPKYAGTPAGKVTIKAGRTAVCVITLKSGKGTCTFTARKLRAGTYTLTAAYPGSTDYAGSAAAKKTLTVAK